MNRLRELRQRKNLTLMELAKIRGVSHASVARAETGERALTDDDIKFFTNYFGVTSDYLLGLTDTKLAFYDQKDQLTEKQQQEVEQFIEFIKKRDGA